MRVSVASESTDKRGTHLLRHPVRPTTRECQTAGAGTPSATEPLPSWIITWLYNGPQGHLHAEKVGGGGSSFPRYRKWCPVRSWQEPPHYGKGTAAGTSAPGDRTSPWILASFGSARPGKRSPRSSVASLTSAAAGALAAARQLPLFTLIPYEARSSSSTASRTSRRLCSAIPASPTLSLPSLARPRRPSDPAGRHRGPAHRPAQTQRAAPPAPLIGPFAVRNQAPAAQRPRGAARPRLPPCAASYPPTQPRTPRTALWRSRWMPKDQEEWNSGGVLISILTSPSSLHPISPQPLHPISPHPQRVPRPYQCRASGAEFGGGLVFWSLRNECLFLRK